MGLEGARGLEEGATGAAEGLCVGCRQGRHLQVSVLPVGPVGSHQAGGRPNPAAFGPAQGRGVLADLAPVSHTELGLQA